MTLPQPVHRALPLLFMTFGAFSAPRKPHDSRIRLQQRIYVTEAAIGLLALESVDLRGT